MKNKYKAIYSLMILSLVVTAVFLVFMPEQVPMHYNAVGEIDRFGSKYENLIFPAFTAVIGILFLVTAKYYGKKKETGNENVLVITGIAVLIIFNLITVFLLWMASSYDPAAATEIQSVNAVKLSVTGIGVLLIILGNIMPKATLNALFGLRTVWSMKNERVWQKCQRFGGYSSIICGLLMITLGILISGIASLYAVMALLLAYLFVCVFASYRIYKKDALSEKGK